MTTDLTTRKAAIVPGTDSRLSKTRATSREVSDNEGHDKAFDQTFGAGKFTISVKGSDSADYDDRDKYPSGVAYPSSSSPDGYETSAFEDFQEFERVMDLAAGGNGNPWDYQENVNALDLDEYTYTPAQYSYGGYSLDTHDPATRDRVMNSKMIFDDFGNPSYYDTGTSCARPNSDIATLYTAAKSDLNEKPLDLADKNTLKMVQSAKVDPETGSVTTDTMCASPEYGQKILEAKAQLDGTGPAVTAVAGVTKQPGGYSDVAGQLGIPGISAQSNDLFIATKGLESRGYFGSKPEASILNASPAVTAPSITDGIAISQKSTTPEFKPIAATPSAPAPSPIA